MGIDMHAEAQATSSLTDALCCQVVKLAPVCILNCSHAVQMALALQNRHSFSPGLKFSSSTERGFHTNDMREIDAQLDNQLVVLDCINASLYVFIHLDVCKYCIFGTHQESVKDLFGLLVSVCTFFSKSETFIRLR